MSSITIMCCGDNQSLFMYRLTNTFNRLQFERDLVHLFLAYMANVLKQNK